MEIKKSKKLVKSRYNIEIETLADGQKLMYNSRTNFLGLMDIKSQELFNKIEAINSKTLEDQDSKEKIETFINYGFTINSDIDELKMLELQDNIRRYSNKDLSLTIAPTMDCNMACFYCYETRNQKVMSKETQDDIMEFIKNYTNYNRSEKVDVTWYGGEPLLEKEIIYSFSERIIEFCNEKDIDYSAAIITNGTLLDREAAEKLAEYKVKFAQITIDGLPETHNNRRNLISGEKGFDVIVNNIDNIKDILDIQIRINVDNKNKSEVPKLINYFIDEKDWGENPSFYVSPVVDYTNCASYDSCISKNDYKDIEIKVIERYKEKSEKIAKNFIYPRLRSNYCSALNMGSYVIAPDGYLYTCWNEIDIVERNVGHIKKYSNLSHEHIKWLIRDLESKCIECKYLPVCQGGCPLNYILHGEAKCPEFIYSLKDKMKLAYKGYLERTE